MCIIVFDKRTDCNTRVSKDILLRSQEKNPDGMGIMFATPSKELKLYRTMDDFDMIWNYYTFARDHQLPVAVHFRVGTAGTLVEDNCHPFRISNGFAFMHNGTINCATNMLKKNDPRSDTRYVAEEIFPKLPGNFLQIPALKNTILTRIWDGGRFVFMDNQSRYTIINEKSGFEDDDVWYSHTRYKEWLLTGHEPAQWKPRHTYSPMYGGFDIWSGSTTKNKPQTHQPYDIYKAASESNYHCFERGRILTRSYPIITSSPTKTKTTVPEMATVKPKDSHRIFRDESSKWYGEDAESKGNLLFSYGELDVTGVLKEFLTPVCKAWIEGHELWQGSASGDSTDTMKPLLLPAVDRKQHDSASDSDSYNMVHGFIYAINGESVRVQEILASMDELIEEDSNIEYTRSRVTAHSDGDLIFDARVWVYIADDGFADLDTRVPFGDWAASAVALETFEGRCPLCSSTMIDRFDMGTEGIRAWCYICEDAFDIKDIINIGEFN